MAHLNGMGRNEMPAHAIERKMNEKKMNEK